MFNKCVICLIASIVGIIAVIGCYFIGKSVIFYNSQVVWINAVIVTIIGFNMLVGFIGLVSISLVSVSKFIDMFLYMFGIKKIKPKTTLKNL